MRGRGAGYASAGKLLRVLERKVGRVLGSGITTGGGVSRGVVQGGAFPPEANAMYSAVGATAIDRFLRPVCYQDLPDALLPEALKHANPLGLWRLVDGDVRQA